MVQLGCSINIQRGRGNIAREVCKVVHAHVNPNPQKKKRKKKKEVPKFYWTIFLVSQKMKDSCKEDGSRNKEEKEVGRLYPTKTRLIPPPCSVLTRGGVQRQD